MKRSLSVFCLLLLSSAAWSQSMMVGVDRADTGASYTGPGNVVSGATAWWGLRAYNGAYAASLGKIAHVCLPSAGACFDVFSDSSGNFNLAGVGGLSTCNNTTVRCTIQTLYDQSGANSCGGGPCDITQATQSNQPLLNVPGAGNGCTTTAHVCAATPGSAVLLQSAAANYTQAQAFTISTVYWITNNSNSQQVMASNSGGVQLIADFGGPNRAVIFSGSSTPFATVSDGVYHSVHAIFNNASSDIVVDGTSNSPLSLGSASGISADRIDILNNGAQNQALVGFFIEMGIWPGTFGTTCASCAAMSSNQHSYWGF